MGSKILKNKVFLHIVHITVTVEIDCYVLVYEVIQSSKSRSRHNEPRRCLKL